MKIRHTGQSDQKIELQMTPMIDIVFQLLVFFIMTFKIVVQEGDFNIKMPLASPQQGVLDENLVPPMKLRLTADAQGNVAGIVLNEQSFSSFDELRNYIIGIVGTDSGPDSIRESAEIELDCDYRLRYEETVKAMTAVTGYRQGDEVVKLIEKVKFAPPNNPDG